MTDTAIDSFAGLDQMLRRANQQLGAAGLRVAKFIDENRQIVLASSAAALGARIGTSDATVLRTIQTLGFASLADLKNAILNGKSVSTPADDMRRTLVDLDKATGAALDGILQAHADKLENMAQALLQYETIDRDQIALIMAGHDPGPPKDWRDPKPRSGGTGRASCF